MAFKASDWWSAKGWLPAPALENERCAVCGSTFGLAMHPQELFIACELHSNCSIHGVRLIQEYRGTGAKISMELWKITRLNSWDRDAIIPHMSDEVLASCVDQTLCNCRRFDSPASTYDDALQLYAKELNERFKKGINR